MLGYAKPGPVSRCRIERYWVVRHHRSARALRSNASASAKSSGASMQSAVRVVRVQISGASLQSLKSGATQPRGLDLTNAMRAH